MVRLLVEWQKKYYYFSRESAVTAQPWKPDSDGVSPAPSIHVDAPCLLRVSDKAVRVLNDAEELAEIPTSTRSFPKRLRVENAGSDFVNGLYERYGEDPLWVNQHNYKMYLRKGSDGHWCLVNNRGKEKDEEKKYYYVNQNVEVTAAAWWPDTHGQDPPPLVQEQDCSVHEQLFQAINPSRGNDGGSALVATPPIPAGCKPLVLTIEHFSNETMMSVVADTAQVSEESFPGLDDECIGCVSQGPCGDVWRYVGK